MTKYVHCVNCDDIGQESSRCDYSSEDYFDSALISEHYSCTKCGASISMTVKRENYKE